MWRGRGKWRGQTLMSGEPSATPSTVKQVTRALFPESVFYDPDAYLGPDKAPQKSTPISAGGKVILAVALGAIVGIGVIGTKMGVRWLD